MVAASKLPMLKPGEYEIWRMRIEQYIRMIDYALWEVIENGATLPKTVTVEGVRTVMPITTTEEKAQRRLEVKAKSTLMMGIPNEHQLKFNSIKGAKKLLEAVEKRFGRNAATRKTQRNLLKQQYENFTAPSSEMLDQTFDRLQKNKADLDTMSMDDLYNNLKVYEPEVKGMSSSSLSTHNMAFVSSSNNNTSSTNESVNTTHGVSTASTQVNAANFTNIDNLSDAFICAFFASQPNSPQLVHEDLQQIYLDDMEEMDLRWQMAMLIMRALNMREIRFLIEYRKKLMLMAYETIGWIRSRVDVDTTSDQIEEGPNYALMVFSSSSPDSEFHSIPRIISTFNADLSFTGLDEFVNKDVVENCKAMSSKEDPKVVRKNDDASIVEEWVSDDEEEDVSQPKTKKTVRPSIVKKEFVKFKQQEKTARKTIKQGNPQMNLQDQRVIDSGCSRHMTWNMSYLTDYEEIDGGYVAFRVNPKEEYLQENDETSGILKSFITRIENLVDPQVKVIRCDNGTEFKNRNMNQFCDMKGILRQFSIDRTPQQNRVVERRNRTLIEDVTTMLANSKAFRVFISKTRIMEENLHIRFSESIPNALGIQSIGFAGSKASDNEDPKSSHDDGSKPSSDDGKKVDEDPRKESECKDLNLILLGKAKKSVRLMMGMLFEMELELMRVTQTPGATTASSLKAEQDSGNINKTQSKATPTESNSSGGLLGAKKTIGDTIAQTRFENVSKLSNDSLLVLDLEKTKTTQANEIASLKMRVKKLEKKDRSRTHRLKMTARVESSDNEESLGEDASKQGRIDAIDVDEEITWIPQDHEDPYEVAVMSVLGTVPVAADQSECDTWHWRVSVRDPITAMNMALVLMAKAFELYYSTPTNNNQRISSNPRNRQIAQPGMNMGQDRHMQMVEGNGGNQFRQYAEQNVGNQNGYNAVQNVGNQVVQHAVQNSATRAEGNAIGNNGNHIRCYNFRGLGHLARNYTVKPRRRDAAYLQTQLLIAQKEEARIQLQVEEFDLMVAAAYLDEIKETDKAPVYELDGSAEVHHYDNFYNNDIFNMFTQEEQYTELLEPIPKPHQVQQNDNNVISKVSGVEQSGRIVDQHPATVEETRAYFKSLYNNLAIEVENVNSVNYKMKETNADLTTELA
ncbi:ribonuclease H-like domain-containing protein, partial [Tanacetum coccineum]